MKVIKKVFLSLFLALVVLGCSKEDDSPKTFTPEQARKAIDDTLNNFLHCLENLNDGEFSKFIYNRVFEGENSFEWNDVFWDKFIDQYGRFEDSERNRLRIEELKGTYTWNNTAQKWDKASNDKQIKLILPNDKKDLSKNNGTLIIEGYEDTKFSFKGMVSYLPKKGKVTALVDNKKVFELTIDNIAVDVNTNFSIPTSAEITIFMNPFTSKIKWVRKTPQIFNLDFTFGSPQGCQTAINGEVKLKTTDYGNITSEKDIEKIVLKTSHNDLQIVTDVDYSRLSDATANKDFADYSIEEINMFAKSEVFYQRSKVADLKIDKDNEGKMLFNLIYSDGSKENAEKYIKDFPVKKIFKKFFGNKE